MKRNRSDSVSSNGTAIVVQRESSPKGDSPSVPCGTRLACLSADETVHLAITEAIEQRRLRWELRPFLRASPIQSIQGALKLWARCPGLRIIGLVRRVFYQARSAALVPGVHGWLLWPASPADLQRVVETVIDGRRGLCQRIRRLLGHAGPADASAWPPDPNCLRLYLHERVVTGDREAGEVLAEHFQEVLTRRLAPRFQQMDRDLIAIAVTDALLDYFQRPSRFNPAQGSLEGFLYIAAWRNVSNLQRGEYRRAQREQVIPEAALGALPAAWADHDGEPELDPAEGDGLAERELFEEWRGTLPP